jgi:hypothetical protein
MMSLFQQQMMPIAHGTLFKRLPDPQTLAPTPPRTSTQPPHFPVRAHKDAQYLV